MLRKAMASLALLLTAGCAGDLDSGDDAGSDATSPGDLTGGPPRDLSGAVPDGGGGGPDAAGPACMEMPFSTFGSVSLHFVNPKCRFTLAEAAAGIDFHYELEVAKDVPDVVPMPANQAPCSRPDDSGLILFEHVTGGGQSWCRCDVGRCAPPSMDPGSIIGGHYAYQLHWAGRNWNGPSDTNTPEGAPFPPGTYDVLVSASGQYTVSGMMLPFSVRDVLSITLVP